MLELVLLTQALFTVLIISIATCWQDLLHIREIWSKESSCEQCSKKKRYSDKRFLKKKSSGRAHANRWVLKINKNSKRITGALLCKYSVPKYKAWSAAHSRFLSYGEILIALITLDQFYCTSNWILRLVLFFSFYWNIFKLVWTRLRHTSLSSTSTNLILIRSRSAKGQETERTPACRPLNSGARVSPSHTDTLLLRKSIIQTDLFDMVAAARYQGTHI